MNIYQAWLLDALFWLGIVIVFFGGYLVIAPKNAMSFNNRVNKWISTDSFFAALDQPRNIDRYYYKWHRTIGTAILISAVYILYELLFKTDIDSAAAMLPIVSNHHANLWLYESLLIFLISMSLIILLVSVVLIVRPSALKRLEKLANRMFTPEKKKRRNQTAWETEHRRCNLVGQAV